ncbi:MAG: glycosyl hydrolase [Ginsengibacter sp.]
MKYSMLSLILATLLMFGYVNKSYGQPEWQKTYNDPKEVRTMFTNPPMFYAPHVFWFWDDTLKNEHFPASMIDEMARQGLNPGYAHPRGRLRLYQTDSYPEMPKNQYLSKLMFNSLDNAVQKSKDKGLTLGYCDEYNWPSGQAADRLLERHPELEAKYLEFKRHEVKGNSTVHYDSLDFAVAGKIVDNKIDASSLQIIGNGSMLTWKAPKGNWVVYTYKKTPLPDKQPVKINYLDNRLMEAFIPMVHYQYEKHLGNEMGKTIPGVFVDNEGNYGWQIAWSDYFAKRFKEIKNRDFLLWLPLLTEKDKDGLFAKARYDWFDVVSQVYIECFIEPVVKWLKQRNMYYISNFWEESLLVQSRCVGDFMRIQRMATMPGNDCLQMVSQDVHDFKETQSVCEFEDKPFMSEIMGAAGWEQTPQQMKMTINSITSFGVTHVVPHGVNLNRKLETIPYPADWFTENSFWPYLHNWTDFARRSAFVTRQGKLVADVLLINPKESVWALAEECFSNEATGNWDKRSVEVNRTYSDAMRIMNKNNVDFLIADTYYMDAGAVKGKNNAARLTIKGYEFPAIVLPSVSVIPRSVSAKILEFAKKGGTVILLGELAQGSTEKGMTDDLVIRQMNELKRQPNVINLAAYKDRMDKMIIALNSKVQPQIRLQNTGRLYTAHRKIGDNDFYWLANNTDTVRNFTAWLKDGEGAAEIWNCETGTKQPVSSTKDGGYNKLDLTLQPYEGYWVVFNREEEAQRKPKQVQTSVKEIILDNNWTLSYPGIDTVYKTAAKILGTSGKEIEEAYLQPGFDDSGWKYFRNENHPRHRRDTSKPAKLENYLYWRTQIPVGTKSIVLPSGMTGMDILIDGEKRRITSSQIEVPGGAGLLSFFITAEKLKTMLTTPFKFCVGKKEDLILKSWYKYGLQQFTGYVDYETNINIKSIDADISLDLGQAKYMAEVFVNDKSVGARLWPPYVFHLTKELKPGNNTIKIRVGGLVIGDFWIKEDLGKLRSWGFTENPDFDKCDAGLFGPVKLLTTK